MIRIYYLETERIANTDTVKGIQYIHDAILDVEGTLRKLIQDTTDIEHTGLIKVAKSWREAEKQEIDSLNDMKARNPIMPSPRDLAKELDELEVRVAVLEKKVK